MIFQKLGSSVTPIAIATILSIAAADVASANSDIDLADPSPMDQVTSVSQLTDVKPTDWAFQALQSLVERYGCIVGYPDKTYRGNRALTRYEFAAGLNACLDKIQELIAAATADFVKKEDLETVKRLQEEFAAELASLRGRVEVLEARTATLETQQFSTTTKLNAQMIWAVRDTFGDRVGGNSDDSQTILAQRTRLNLETSFTGKDLFRTRLEFSNFGDLSATTGTNMMSLNFDDNTGNNRVLIPHLRYYTPIGAKLSLVIGPAGIGFTDITDTVTPATVADDGLGVPSRFGEYNPFFRRGGGGAAINWNISPNLVLTTGYLAGGAGNKPSPKDGLFNGPYSAVAHLVWYGKSGALGLGYAHLFANANKVNITADTGSFLARQPFGDRIATSTDLFSIQGYYQFTPKFQIHGFAAYAKAYAESSGISNLANGRGGTVLATVDRADDADIFWAAIGFTFPDVGGKGNLPGVLVGLPGRVVSSDVREDRDTSYHVEAFYRFRVNDFIAITPGAWVVFNPENDSRNDTQWTAFVRTTFNF